MTPAKNRPKMILAQDTAITLTVEEAIRLSGILRQNVIDKDSLFHAARLCSTVSVEGVPITLEPRLLQRLRSRCLDKDGFPNWLAEVIVKQLHDYVGWTIACIALFSLLIV